jgi:RHS repeat-associated protein
MKSLVNLIRLLNLALFVAIALCSFSPVAAQQITDGHTPLGLTPGAPAGSYPLSEFDNINLFNGSLNFSLPLVKVGGRGDAGYPIVLRLEQKWRVDKEQSEGQPPINLYYPQPGWWTDFGWAPVYSMGRIEIRQGGTKDYVIGGGGCTGYVHRQTLTRLTFIAPDGTEYELRDQGTNGQPVNATCPGLNREKVFNTADGTSATFISDSDIVDYPYDNPGNIPPSGFMMLKDGTRYRIDNGNVSWMRDRNGNKLTFTYDTFQRMTAVTDSLNRQVTIAYGGGDGTYDQITYKGFGGASRTIKVHFRTLSAVLRSDIPWQSLHDLFPELNGVNSGYVYYEPPVVSAVELPNGKQYAFRYNGYAELTRVILPTGGAIEYDYAAGLTDSGASGVISGLAEKFIYRRVVERRLYPDGGSGLGFSSRMTYSRPESSTTNAGFVVTDQYDSNGSLLGRSHHYFNGSARASFFKQPTEYPAWNDGREYKTETFDTNGTTLLRRAENNFQNRAAVSWWTGGSATEPPNDVRPTSTITTLVDANLVSKQEFGYDDSVPFNNQNNVKEYDFGSGAPGALLRETRTTYLTSANYTAGSSGTSPHIRNLPLEVSVFNGTNNEKARTKFEYDNYATDSYHAPLVSRSSVSGLCAAIVLSPPGCDNSNPNAIAERGNRTATTRYFLVNGSAAGSISAYSQYDVLGNVVKTIDPRSTPTNIIATTLEYNDRFGAPDGNAQTPTTPDELSGLNSFAYPTKITNAAGHISYSQLDYYLGKPVDGEDANGIVASGYYNDALDRPTQIRRAVGSSLQNQTTFAYDDTNRIITTNSDRDNNNDNILVHKVLYDLMGRTIETRQYEGGTNYIATQIQYDALGRAYKTSNPFRPSPEVEISWTTQAFDALGRMISVSTPDGAVVKTAYSGNRVLVADQNTTDALRKKRISVTDGLGRLKEVWEITAADSASESVTFPGYTDVAAGYVSRYDYDALDNLTGVSQRLGPTGANQVRSFNYDSLRRLTSATNPESGTISYQYDSNGNLAVKTDARIDPNDPNKKVSSHFEYDSLNRVTRRWYNGSNSLLATTHNSPSLPTGVGATDEVKFYYDSQSLPTGAPGAPEGYSRGAAINRLVAQTYGAGSNGDYFAYDVLGRQTLKFQQTGGINYKMSAVPNLAGALTALVYPSDHIVNYGYDAAGRTSSFSGNLGDGVSRTYASTFVYNPRDQVTQELFGTQTPLYHKLQYNIRGQLWDVRVSTGSDINGSWNRGCLQFFYDGSYGYGTSGPDNNGNVLKSNHYVPLDDQSSTWAIHRQIYNYDSLNRISSVAEYFVSDTQAESQQSLQGYTYDRYGNRTINTSTTYGTGINNKAFTVDTNTNRLGVPSGQTGTMHYDAAGNLDNDTYTGAGNRTYDAENKITSAWGGNNQAQLYSYDASGQRIKRKVDGVETWQVYGFGGELVAEYGASGPSNSPQKEYGYRNGELLITGETGPPAPPSGPNYAATSAGATATASSTYSGIVASKAIDGDHVGTAGHWADDTSNVYPDWLQVDFSGSKTISEIDVFGLQQNPSSPVEPTLTMTSSYALTNFSVEYWTGSAWAIVPGGSVTGNDKVWRKFTFAPLTTSKIRVNITAVAGDNHSQIVEVEAWTPSNTAKVSWLVSDQLGTPRMILDQTGSRENVKRHDYLPFGEELVAGVGSRSTAQGYGGGDGVRQQFTQKERDVETGLDYFLARYYSSIQGRFTSPDPLLASGSIYDPQTWNRYSYTLNNPLKYIDPFGLYVWNASLGGNATDEELRRRAGNDRDALRAANRIIDRRNDFRNALAAAARARDALPAGADRDLVSASLDSYGAEGVANGVSVSTGGLADGVAAEARTAYFDFQNGTFTAQVEVVLSDRGGGNLAVDVAHEGRHVADAQEFAAALTADVAANGAQSTVAIMGATNRTRYEREVRGYTVSSLVARGLGLDNLNITPSNGRNYEIWNRGWRNVDRERLRGINNLLRESPTYGLTPANQGQRYITP